MKPNLGKSILLGALAVLCWAPTALANPDFVGRWRMDPDQSSALDGWQKMDLVLEVHGSQVDIAHDMQWRTTKLSATNTYDTAQPVVLKNYFRVEARHMAVYPARNGATRATATWLDAGRTLRIEAETPVEASQGMVTMRLYQEYRLGERGQTLTLIELHSSRNSPLVYVFHRVNEEKTK